MCAHFREDEAPPRRAEGTTIRGRVVRVSPSGNTFVVRGAEGREVEGPG